MLLPLLPLRVWFVVAYILPVKVAVAEQLGAMPSEGIGIPTKDDRRLGEDGNFVRDGIRNDVKVRDGEGEVLRVGPVLVHDAEDGPVRAVVPGAVRLEAAGLAGGTGEVDVTTDALAHQLLAVVRR